MKLIDQQTGLLLFTLLLYTQLCVSQQPPTRATNLLKKGIELIDVQQDYTKGIKTLNAAIELSPPKELLVQIRYAKAVALNSKGALTQAAEILEKNIPVINTCPPTLKIKFHANNYRVLGDIYKSKGKALQAMEYYQQALNFSEKHNAYSRAMVLHQIAVLLLDKKEYKEAEKYLHLATDEYLNDNLKLGKYINLGEVYVKTAKLEKAREHYVKAQKLAIEANNNNALCHIYIGFANVFFEDEHYEQAITYYEKAFSLSERIETRLIKASSLLNLAISYERIGRYFKALPYLDQAAKVLKDKPSRTYMLHLYNTYASVYEKTGSYEKSVLYLKKAGTLKDSMFNAEKNKQFEELKISYETEKKQHTITLLTLQKRKKELEVRQQQEKLKNLKLEKALEAAKQQNTILELEQNKADNENKIVLLKRRHAISRAEANRSRLIKNAFLIGFFLFLIPLGALLFVYSQKLKTQKTLAVKQKELSRRQILEIIKDQQLKTIRASVKGQEQERKRIARELHDSIGGSLAAVKLQLDNISEKHPKLTNAINHLDETYEQVRHISHDLLSKKIQENPFVDLIHNYLENIASSSGIEINFSPYDRKAINKIGVTIQACLYKIIQELISNTIKHAKASLVEVQLNAHTDMINLLFEDNGKGFIKKENKKGIGLHNIQERVYTLHGTIDINSAIGRGTLVNITVPTKKQQNDL